jgi:predicted TIM-barrel fold metal-dependent hydrolase
MSEWPRIIDADGHVVETDVELYEYFESPYREMKQLRSFAFFPSLDGWPRSFLTPFSVGRTDAPDWLAFLDEVGIEQAVLYPTKALAHGLIQDREWACAVARAYNNWLHDRYCRVSPRLKGVALLPSQDVTAAIAELRRAVTEQGMVAGVLPAATRASRPYGHPDFHPLWAEAQRLDVPLTIHGAPSNGFGFDHFDTFVKAHTLEHLVPQMIQMTSIVLDGVLELFPRVRVGFLEAGASWVPWMMDRLDYEYGEAPWGGPEHAPNLRQAPSAYLSGGQVYVTCEGEERILPAVAQVFGANHLMYPSDFPHEQERPYYRQHVEELLAREDLDATLKRKILSENAVRFYRLEPARNE